MTSLFRFPTHSGRERTLLALYILHSLSDRPKSGYDLMKGIAEKTGGTWAPSKGTLYPLLSQLEEEGLIVVTATEKRSRRVYSATPEGKEMLASIRCRGKEHHRKLARYRTLLTEVFGVSEHSVKGLLFAIRAAADDVPPGKEKEAIAALERCREELFRIATS